MSEDPWDQVMWVFDHTDVHLVSDALKILERDEPDFLKIGRLQLLISDWEAKNLSPRQTDGSGNLLRKESHETAGVSQEVPRLSQGQDEGLLEEVLSREQTDTEREAQAIREEERRRNQSKEPDSLLSQTSSQEETRSRRGRSC